MADESPLDNPFLHALTGPLRAFADIADGDVADGGLAGGGAAADVVAAVFHDDVSPFAAIAADDQQSWDGLASITRERRYVVCMALDRGSPPDGWSTLMTETGTQWVADDLPPAGPVEGGVIDLGADDVDEMLDLVRRTEPGPFEQRTIELGRWIGVRREGELVAMAGERLRLDGWTEISGVCVAESARRAGLAGALTLVVAEGIRARGDEAFLHVREGNDGANGLYERLGFRARCKVEIGVYAPPPR